MAKQITQADLDKLKREIMQEVGQLLAQRQPANSANDQSPPSIEDVDAIVELIDSRIGGFSRNLLYHNGRAPFELRASSVRFALRDMQDGTFALDMLLPDGGHKKLKGGS